MTAVSFRLARTSIVLLVFLLLFTTSVVAQGLSTGGQQCSSDNPQTLYATSFPAKRGEEVRVGVAGAEFPMPTAGKPVAYRTFTDASWSAHIEDWRAVSHTRNESGPPNSDPFSYAFNSLRDLEGDSTKGGGPTCCPNTANPTPTAPPGGGGGIGAPNNGGDKGAAVGSSPTPPPSDPAEDGDPSSSNTGDLIAVFFEKAPGNDFAGLFLIHRPLGVQANFFVCLPSTPPAGQISAVIKGVVNPSDCPAGTTAISFPSLIKEFAQAGVVVASVWPLVPLLANPATVIPTIIVGTAVVLTIWIVADSLSEVVSAISLDCTIPCDFTPHITQVIRIHQESWEQRIPRDIRIVPTLPWENRETCCKARCLATMPILPGWPPAGMWDGQTTNERACLNHCENVCKDFAMTCDVLEFFDIFFKGRCATVGLLAGAICQFAPGL